MQKSNLLVLVRVAFYAPYGTYTAQVIRQSEDDFWFEAEGLTPKDAVLNLGAKMRAAGLSGRMRVVQRVGC